MLLIYKDDLVLLLGSICDSLEIGYCEDAGYGYFQISNCSEKVQQAMPAIELQIGSYRYFHRNYTTLLGSICSINLFASKEKRWILGSPFLNSHFQVYDMHRNQVGLSSNESSIDEAFSKSIVLKTLSFGVIFFTVLRNSNLLKANLFFKRMDTLK